MHDSGIPIFDLVMQDGEVMTGPVLGSAGFTRGPGAEAALTKWIARVQGGDQSCAQYARVLPEKNKHEVVHAESIQSVRIASYVPSWKRSWLALDTETSGSSDAARILSIAIIHFVDGEPWTTYAEAFDPGPIAWGSPEVRGALRVNRLTRKYLQLQSPIGPKWPRILRALRQSDVWCAHNAPFDLRMLRKERSLWDQQTGQCSDSLVPRAITLDTIGLDAALWPQAKSHSLAEACQRWNVEQRKAHEAEGDAWSCGALLRAMAPVLPDNIRAVSAMAAEGRSQWQRLRGR